MSHSNLYPFKFHPQLVEKVWGGNKLSQLFQKHNTEGKIGESWEISGVTNHISIVANGALKGTSLTHLIEKYKDAFVGKNVYERFGNEFPLLFKFIDAAQDLSVQVHPDDHVAKQKHNSFGKTEMWYVLQADKNARLIMGFKEPITSDTYIDALQNGKLVSLLHEQAVEEGDAFFVPPGIVHAIGAGIVLAEIQQTSDITYRIYDWDRPDVDGNLRELHTQEALEVVNFDRAENTFLQYEEANNESIRLCKSPYFVTSKWQLTKDIVRDYSLTDSFVVIMCVSGVLEIQTEHTQTSLQKGETLLIPAYFNNIQFKTQGATILEVYVPPKG